MSEIKRYDPISYHDTGGWSWDTGAIKECEDGDYVKWEDFLGVVHDLTWDLCETYDRIFEIEQSLSVSEDRGDVLEAVEKIRKLLRQLDKYKTIRA